MAKIYTKTGDDGLTGLLAFGRYAKNDPRIEAYGTVDELNACLGVARTAAPLHWHRRENDRDDLTRTPALSEQGVARLVGILDRLQNELFVLGSALADPAPDGPFFASVTMEHVEGLERLIDDTQERLPALQQFLLPGGTPAAAALHLARTVCRRAERCVVALTQTPNTHVHKTNAIYLNRLGDLLFVLARLINQTAGVPEVLWKGL